MIKARKLGHIVLNVSNLDASREFYCKALGLGVVCEHAPGRIVFLSLGEQHHDLALVERAAGPADPTRSGLVHMAWQVDDFPTLQAAYTELRAAGIEPEPQEIALQMLQLSGPALWGAAALAVLVMPLLEEILFRAFLQPLLVSALGVTGGVGATSVAFAALHGASAFLPIFTLSLVLGAVMLRTRRLSSAFCVHALHNGVTLLLLFLLPGSRELLGSEGALPCPSLP